MNLYLYQRVLGIGILGLQIILGILILYLVYKKITKKSVLFIDTFFKKQGMLITGFTALFAIIGSLIFSDVYHIEPCKLCWIQRILIYPQALIMFIAKWRRDSTAWLYSLWLSIIGLGIALYQVNEQLGVSNIIPKAECVIGPDAACAKIHMLEFGYITFPLASATLFAFIIVIYLIQKKSA